MKIYRPIYFGILDNLALIFNENQYADKVIDRSFKKNKKWGAKDRRLIAEVVYDMVRWWRKLCYSLDYNDVARYSDDHLADLMELYFKLRGWEIPDFAEEMLPKDILKRWEEEKPLEVEESIADWIYQEGCEQLGEKDWSELLHSMNKQASIYLRLNKLKTDFATLKKNLIAEEIEVEEVEGSQEALRLVERKNLFITDSYKRGEFEVQDGGSQHIAPMIDIKPSMRIIDACAGAGGKALHLASLMGNKGKIIAMDINQWKLDELRKRSKRAGADIIETRLIDGQKTLKRLKASADALLLDVPCSGIGVLKRSPDRKWKFKQEEFERLKFTQAQILEDYSSMLKPGGQMVYATCSLWPEENEKQVQAFLNRHKDEWELKREINIWPNKKPFDGFYAASLIKK